MEEEHESAAKEESPSPRHDETITREGDTFSGEVPPRSQVGVTAEWVGRTLGKYQVTGLLGEGGMGVVYRAFDEGLDREVAVKVLPADLAQNPTTLARFLQEAKAAGKLDHPHVVSIFDIGVEGDTHFIVMELLPEGNVQDIIDENGAFDPRVAVEIVADACRGVTAAHEQGLIHRDIKPGNLLRSRHGQVKVADFGLAKATQRSARQLTQTGGVLGTPAFMSPEQCRSKPLDQRSDVYSLGATLYTLLTGEIPYHEAGTAVQIMFEHCSDNVLDPRTLRPEISSGLAAIVAKATATIPEDRYQTAAELLVDLEREQQGLAPRARSAALVTTKSAASAAGPQTPETRSRKGWLIGGGIAAGLVLAVVLGAAVVSSINGTSDSTPVVSNKATAPGVTADTITFGTSAVYSGPSGNLGEAMTVGIRAYFEDVNERGGVHGRMLKLVVLDDRYEPEQALQNMRELFEEREVFAVVGNVGAPTAKAALPYAMENRRLFFGAYSGAQLLRQDPPDRYVFNYRASYADETHVMVDYFVNKKKISPSEIAVFAQNDEFGNDGFQGVARALAKHGVDPANILRVGYERNSIQVDTAVAEIEQAQERVKAIVMVATYKAAARFIRGVRQKQLTPVFANVSFVGSNLLAEEFREIGAEFGEGVIVTQVVPHYESNATGVIRYRELLKKHHPEHHPDFVSLEGFIVAETLVAGLEEAGPNLTTESLVDAFESLQNLDLGIGPIINFGPSRHQASQKIWGTMLDSQGSYSTVELE